MKRCLSTTIKNRVQSLSTRITVTSIMNSMNWWNGCTEWEFLFCSTRAHRGLIQFPCFVHTIAGSLKKKRIQRASFLPIYVWLFSLTERNHRFSHSYAMETRKSAMDWCTGWPARSVCPITNSLNWLIVQWVKMISKNSVSEKRS
jgi:hypothetical protein